MAWVRVDDKMARGPKVKRAAAILGGKFPRRRILSVWLEAMSYCNLNLTDGFMPDYEVADLEDERPAEVFRCMSAGDDTLGAIVERDDQRGGWVFRNYLDYQPSKASIEEKAEIDRKRKAEYRASKIRPRVSQECPNGTDTDGAKVSATTGPDRPGPTRTGPDPIQERVRTERAPSAIDPDFELFWKRYPNKTAKAKALASWRKMRPPVKLVLDALAWQVNQPKWTKDGGEFVPHAATWLNQSRWQDEPFNAPIDTDPNEAMWERVKARLVNKMGGVS